MWRNPWVAHLTVVAVVAVTFVNSLGGEFVWDDRSLIVENETLRDWSALPGVFLRSFEESAASGAEISLYYRPLVLVSYAWDGLVYGFHPLGFHLTNVFLHLACCLLVLRIAGRWVGPEGGLLAAIVFAVHPVHTESVSWISGRTDLLAGVFVLSSFLAYLRAREVEEGAGRWIGLSAGLFLVSLFCKEVVFLYPVFLVVFEWALRKDAAGLRVIPHFAVLFLFLVFYGGIVGLSATQLGEGFNEAPAFPFRIGTAFKLLGLYVLKLVFPVKLNAEWEPGWIVSPSLSLFLWPALVTLGIGAAVVGRKGRPLLLVAVAWFVLLLAPVLNVFPIKEIAAERFLYLPAFSLALLVGWGWERIQTLRVASVLPCVVIVLFGVRTVDRNADWRDGLRLFEVTAADSVGAPRARFNLAKELHRQGLQQLEAAASEGDLVLESRARANLEKALRGYREVMAEGYRNVSVTLGLAQVHLALDEVADAIRTYEDGIAAFPGSLELRFGLCDLRFRLGEDEKAGALARRILSENPEFHEARRILGILAYRQEDLERAERELVQAAAHLPGRADVFQVLGVIYSRQRRIPAAVAAYQRALEIDPVDLTSMGNLAKLYAYSPPGSPYHRPNAAVQLAERAARFDPRAEFYQTLAQAHAALGEFDRAFELLDEILQAGPPDPTPYLEMKKGLEKWRASQGE